MPKLTKIKKWQTFGTLITSVALSVNLIAQESNPVFANEYHNAIASRMLELQDSAERWISIDLTRQRLVAWEGNKAVYAVIVSTGKRSTPTRLGTFKIYTKYQETRMTGPDYDVPDVPYTMYYDGGMAIHGAYWHNLFGTPVTHGCTNVAVDHAQWLFEWASVGTPVVVHE
ncbi:MAG: L,D-transpeptidase [Cyanobacteriota bacterium]|nr:L,D-transpeptidase [Cyanobacteriota bacterium]